MFVVVANESLALAFKAYSTAPEKAQSMPAMKTQMQTMVNQWFTIFTL
jgi:hypothetical protein